MARTKDYVKKEEELEKFIRDNRLVSKEAQMNQMMGEGYRDPRFIATTGNKNIDHWGLHPLAAEGSGQVLSTDDLGMEGPDSLRLGNLGTYNKGTDKMTWKDTFFTDKEAVQVHEIIHRATHKSGWMDNYRKRLRNKVGIWSNSKFENIVSEGLGEAYEHKKLGGDLSDDDFRTNLHQRVEKFTRRTNLSSKKTTDSLLKALPTLIEDFETYLEELDTESYKAGGYVMNYGDYGRSYT